MGVEQYFAGMESVKSMGGGQYFKGEGRFLCTLRRMFVNDGHKGRFFIAEFQIDESTTDADPIGCTRSWVTPLTGKPDRVKYSFGDIKNLVFALLGKDPKTFKDPAEYPAEHSEATKIVMAACDETGAYGKKVDIDPGLLIGEQVQLETVVKSTKEGGTFTTHNWSPVAAH